MNVQRYFIGSNVVFVFLFIVEWIFHGLIMDGFYDEARHLLRPETEGGSCMIWMIIGFLLMAFGFCFIFTKGYENKGIGEGIRFGLYVAIAFSVSASLMSFAAFPYPTSWVIGWIIGETALSYLGLGLRPPIVSWGVMLQDCQKIAVVADSPWLLAPAGAVFVAVIALNFLGDGLRDAADPYQL